MENVGSLSDGSICVCCRTRKNKVQPQANVCDDDGKGVTEKYVTTDQSHDNDLGSDDGGRQYPEY